MEKKINGDNVPEEVIVIENPETLPIDLYFGKVVSTHEGYIYISEVKRGYESIPTNGDVFAPVAKDGSFTIGQTVQFSTLSDDQKRPSKFRTENIKIVDDQMVSAQRIEAIMSLAKNPSPYHDLRKVISADDVHRAAENQPLVNFVRQIAWMFNDNKGYDPETIINLANDFIKKNFNMLESIGVKFSITSNFDENAEKSLIDETLKLYEEIGMTGQKQSLLKEYAQFEKVRRAFSLMHNGGLLNYSSIIPIENLPELSFAFPVWYVYSSNNLSDETGMDDPRPNHAVRFFSDSIGSVEFAWFYQMYNRRTRSLSQFQGRDIMPPRLVKILKEAKQNFDYVTIMTPYHDQASREWSDPKWLRNIDPIMVGFLKGLPYMFILGRWSGTGIFPLLLDCIADTSNHLKINKHLLQYFSERSYWYKGSRTTGNEIDTELGNSNKLVRFADVLLLAYDRGLLFPFLRGELKDDPEYKFLG